MSNTSRFTGKTGSRIEDRGSRIEDRGSRIGDGESGIEDRLKKKLENKINK